MLSKRIMGVRSDGERRVMTDAKSKKILEKRTLAKGTLCIIVALLFSMLQGCLIVPVPHQRTHVHGLKGRVVDEAGAPVPNTEVVTEEHKFGGITITRKAVTDSNGYLKVKPVKKWHGAYCIVLLNIHDGQPTGFSIFPDGYVPASATINIYVSGSPEQKTTARYHFGEWIDSQSLDKRKVATLQGNYLVFEKIVLRNTPPEAKENQ